MDKLEFQDIRDEESRTYHFAHGCFAVDGVIRICVRPSGTHRLETSDGKRYVVAPGWLAIEVIAKEWSL